MKKLKNTESAQLWVYLTSSAAHANAYILHAVTRVTGSIFSFWESCMYLVRIVILQHCWVKHRHKGWIQLYCGWTSLGERHFSDCNNLKLPFWFLIFFLKVYRLYKFSLRMHPPKVYLQSRLNKFVGKGLESSHGVIVHYAHRNRLRFASGFVLNLIYRKCGALM